MNSGEWEASNDPEPMLAQIPPARFQRELQLFVVACALRIWTLLPPESRAEVVGLEQFANGLIPAAELHRLMTVADQVAQQHYSGGCAPDARAYAESAAGVSLPTTIASVQSAISCAASAAACAAAGPCAESDYDRVYYATRVAECAAQAALLRTLVRFPIATEQ